LNHDRDALGLTQMAALQNAPPLLAFTTVALGGFRGLISNLLWIRATDLQEDDKFFEAAQLADWITDMEPRFVQVWAFQAWNMAWNISVKFKDAADRWRYPVALVNQVRQLAQQQTDAQIALVLNQEGCRSAKGQPFTARRVAWIRWKHRIPAPARQQPGEWTVRQLSQKFAVSLSVVYYWLHKGLVTARRPQPNGQMWITLTDQQEQALQAWVANSKRMASSKSRAALNEIASGVV